MCQVTVGVLGDVCRAVEEQIYPFCDVIMQTLLTNLQAADVHRNIKPQILSAFGDISLAIGDRFEVGGRAGGWLGGWVALDCPVWRAAAAGAPGGCRQHALCCKRRPAAGAGRVLWWPMPAQRGGGSIFYAPVVAQP